MGPFHQLIEELYGVSTALPRRWAVYDQAMRQYNTSRSNHMNICDDFEKKYTNATDPFATAMAKSVSNPIYSDVFGFLTNALLVAVPFRHEAVWVEVEYPHAVWSFDEGWWQEMPVLDPEGSADPRLGPDLQLRWQRAGWIYSMLPDHDVASRKGTVQVYDGENRRRAAQGPVLSALVEWASTSHQRSAHNGAGITSSHSKTLLRLLYRYPFLAPGFQRQEYSSRCQHTIPPLLWFGASNC